MTLKQPVHFLILPAILFRTSGALGGGSAGLAALLSTSVVGFITSSWKLASVSSAPTSMGLWTTTSLAVKGLFRDVAFPSFLGAVAVDILLRFWPLLASATFTTHLDVWRLLHNDDKGCFVERIDNHRNVFRFSGTEPGEGVLPHCPRNKQFPGNPGKTAHCVEHFRVFSEDLPVPLLKSDHLMGTGRQCHKWDAF